MNKFRLAGLALAVGSSLFFAYACGRNGQTPQQMVDFIKQQLLQCQDDSWLVMLSTKRATLLRHEEAGDVAVCLLENT
jgi:hypothetical protein